MNMMTPIGIAMFDEASDKLDQADFERIATYMASATGIKLTHSKKIMVESRLRRRVRATGMSSLAEYVDTVFRQAAFDDEILNLINVITTNKTDFFREPSHFEFIAQRILPEIAASGRTGKFWSAASSTGAEPYTLAMVLADFALSNPAFNFKISASDISTDVLEVARRAVYPTEMMSPVPPQFLSRYVMLPNNPNRQEVRMTPEIRALVQFSRINLVERRYPVDHDMDVILCRNLLIYFDKETQFQVVERLLSCLRPNGYLILGHSDSIASLDLPVRPLGGSIFRRR